MASTQPGQACSSVAPSQRVPTAELHRMLVLLAAGVQASPAVQTKAPDMQTSASAPSVCSLDVSRQ